MSRKTICMIIIILIIVLILGFFIYYIIKSRKPQENFWGIPTRSIKMEKILKDKNDKFFQSPNYQPLLSPRFSNVDYGPNIRTNLPYYSKFGVTEQPISNEQTPFMNEKGEFNQPIIYDRYLYANRRSRLRSQGDPIRGDLPIVPLSGNWFIPSVNPNVDLQTGAINVLAGVDNDTNKDLANLIYKSSGNSRTTIGGVDLQNVNVNPNSYEFSNPSGDINVTSFP